MNFYSVWELVHVCDVRVYRFLVIVFVLSLTRDPPEDSWSAGTFGVEAENRTFFA